MAKGRKTFKMLASEIEDIKHNIVKNRETYDKNKKKLGEMDEGISILKEEYEIDMAQEIIKLEEGLETIQPTFQFQKSKRWEDIQKKAVEFSIKKKEREFVALMQKIEDSRNSVEAQQVRIPKEEAEMLNRLKKMGIDVSDIDDGDTRYIG